MVAATPTMDAEGQVGLRFRPSHILCAEVAFGLEPAFRQQSKASDNNRHCQFHENGQVTRHDDARCCKTWIGGRSWVDGKQAVGLVAFAPSCYTAAMRVETWLRCRQPGAIASEPDDDADS